MDEARIALNNKDIAGAKTALLKTSIPYKDFRDWFKPKKVNGVLQPARLSLDQEFRLVDKNKSIIDMDSSLAKSLSMLLVKLHSEMVQKKFSCSQFQVAYTRLEIQMFFIQS